MAVADLYTIINSLKKLFEEVCIQKNKAEFIISHKREIVNYGKVVPESFLKDFYIQILRDQLYENDKDSLKTDLSKVLLMPDTSVDVEFSSDRTTALHIIASVASANMGEYFGQILEEV